MALSGGLRLGAVYVTQTGANLSAHWMVAPQGEGLVRFDVRLSEHLFVGLEAAARLIPVRQQDAARGNPVNLIVQPLGSLGLGANW